MTTLKSFIISIIISISTFPSFISPKPYCNQTCPGSILNHVQYPFGFSSSCEIQLNCTSNGTISVNEFTVHELNQEELLVSLPTMCGRPIESLHHLYNNHYAPTYDNAILLENCTNNIQKCKLPQTMMQPNLEVIDCNGQKGVYGNVSCYSGDKNSMFLDYENVTKSRCRFLLSGTVAKINGDTLGVSLHVQVVKLGWWLKGRCKCSDDAICTEFVSPVDGGDAYRCRCKDGFVGDGYEASSGCRKGVKDQARKDREIADKLRRCVQKVSDNISTKINWSYRENEKDGVGASTSTTNFELPGEPLLDEEDLPRIEGFAGYRTPSYDSASGEHSD